VGERNERWRLDWGALHVGGLTYSTPLCEGGLMIAGVEYNTGCFFHLSTLGISSCRHILPHQDLCVLSWDLFIGGQNNRFVISHATCRMLAVQFLHYIGEMGARVIVIRDLVLSSSYARPGIGLLDWSYVCYIGGRSHFVHWPDEHRALFDECSRHFLGLRWNLQ
jgi:hypothetical protein